MMRVLLLTLLACLLLGGRAEAGCPPLPYVFVPGTTADANQVNANFNSVAACAGTGSITVANLAALRAACTSTTGCPAGHPVFLNGVIRLTDGVAGAPPLYFSIGSGACSRDDGASCVNSANGNQWDARFPGQMDFRQFEAVGDGATDNATAWANAVAAGASLRIPIYICSGIYGMSAGATAAGNLTIAGCGGGQGQYVSTCLSGLRRLTNNMTFLTSAYPVTVKSLCTDDAGGVTNTSGSDFALLASGTNSPNNSLFENNQFNDACISLDLSGTSSQQFTGGSFNNNLIRPAQASGCAGFRLGINSTHAETGNFIFSQNVVYCSASGVANVADGKDIYDAGGTTWVANQIFGCNVGTFIEPGANQAVLDYFGQAGDISGDTSYTDDLEINPTSATATIFSLIFDNTWASNAIHGPSVLIKNSGNTGNYSGLYFSQLKAYAHGSNSNDAIDLYGGTSNSPKNVHISAVTCSSGNSAGAAINIEGGSTPFNGDFYITDSHLSGCDHFSGVFATGLAVNTSSFTNGSVTGTNFYNATTPISWTPTAPQPFILSNNPGLDDQLGSPLSISSSNLTIDFHNIGFVTNAGGSFNLLGPAWSNRSYTIVPTGAGGVTFATGGTASGGLYPLCSGVSVTISQFTHYTFIFDSGIGCWN